MQINCIANDVPIVPLTSITSPLLPPSSTASGSYISPLSTAVTMGAISPYLYSCTKRQQVLLREAWAEAGVLADAHNQWWPGGKWQAAMSLYLGPKSKDD